MVTNKNAHLAQRTQVEKERIGRFVSTLNQAMVVNGFSQRRLAREIGVESGTFTKYLQGRIDPLRVSSGIQANVAKALGVTCDALMAYYNEGRYLTDLGLTAIEAWIKSEAGQQDLPALLGALQEAGRRWSETREDSCGGAATLPEPKPEPVVVYEWPIRAIERLGIPQGVLDRMGVTEEALRALSERGEFDDELVEGFSLVADLEDEVVRKAFEAQEPVPRQAERS